MIYRVEISDSGKSDLRKIVDYLANEVGGTGNAQAASHFLREYQRVIERLAIFPRGHRLYRDKRQHAEEIRTAHFGHMRYKVFFHIDGDAVIIDMVASDLQNPDNWLEK